MVIDTVFPVTKGKRMSKIRLTSLITFVLAVSIASSADWPQWRGPGFDGSADEKDLPVSFSATENILWATAMPGSSSATPVISEGKVFVTSTDRADNKKLLAICLDAKTGKHLWQKDFTTSGQRVPRNDMATPSPAADGSAVYFLFGSGDLAATDYDGNILWTRNIQEEYGNISIKFGYSSSPLVYENKLYILVHRRPKAYREPKNTEPLDSFLLAINPKTGRDIFKHTRITDAIEEAFDSYTSPIPFEFNGQKQIIIMAADYVTSHDPLSGQELWRYEYAPSKHPMWRNIASVVPSEGIIYGVRSRGSGLFALKPSTKGTLDESSIAWTFDGPTPDSSTPLCYQGNIYVVEDFKKKIMTCLDAKTGKQKWQGKLPGKTPYYASFTASDGKLFGMDESGQMVIVDANASQLKVLSTFAFNEKPSRASIAIANGKLFIRTAAKLYCIGK